MTHEGHTARQHDDIANDIAKKYIRQRNAQLRALVEHYQPDIDQRMRAELTHADYDRRRAILARYLIPAVLGLAEEHQTECKRGDRCAACDLYRYMIGPLLVCLVEAEEEQGL